METVAYSRNSLYAQTDFFGKYLDTARFINIPKNPDDVLFTVNKTYQNRPD